MTHVHKASYKQLLRSPSSLLLLTLAALTSLASLASLVSITHSRHLSLSLMGKCRSILVEEDLLKVECQRVLLLGTVASVFFVEPNF